MSDTPAEDDAQTPAPSKHKRTRDAELWFQRPMEKYRRKRMPDFKPNLAFFKHADPVMEANRTLLRYDRLYGLWQTARNVANVPGAVAEIGTFRGGSAYFLASVFLDLTGSEVPLHVFDTFEGHVQQAITENDPFHTAGQFSDTGYEYVRDYLAAFTQVQLYKGDVADSLPRVAEATYRLVHIDTDLYQPTIVCLDYFGSRLSTGGVIVVDDYGQKKCPGVVKAVAEYADRADGWQAWDMRTEQLVLVKR